MKNSIKILAAAAVATLSAESCTRGNLDMAGLFMSQSPDVNRRFAQSMQYNESHPAKTYAAQSEDYRVFVFTDVHIDSVTTELDAFVKAVLEDGDHAPVAIGLGDLQNAYGNLPLFLDHIKPLDDSPKDNFIPVLGNHDLYYGQWSEYVKNFGTASYHFYITTPSGAKDLFICMDSGSGVVGLKQRKWLENVLRDNASCRHKVICTHTHFFKRDASQQTTGNYPLEEGYALQSLFTANGVDLVMTGHDHYFEDTMFKGVYYRTFASLTHNDPQSWYSVVHFGEKNGEFEIEDIRVR